MSKYSVTRTQSYDFLGQEVTPKQSYRVSSEKEKESRGQLVSKRPNFSKHRNSVFEPKHPIVSQIKSSKQIPRFLVAKILNEPDVKVNSPVSTVHKHTQSENSNFLIPGGFSSASKSKIQIPANFYSPQKSSCKELGSPYRLIRKSVSEIKPKKKTPNFPCSGSELGKLYMNELSEFERSELLYYSEVYFTGKISEKKFEPDYDDEKGNYKVTPGDHIAYRYEVLTLLGSGSFGKVYKVLDHKTQTEQALKLLSSHSRFQEQAFIEVKILKFLKKHDPDDSFSIVHIIDYFSFRQHICITFELLSLSLYDLLKSNSFRGLGSSLIRRFASQILHALLLLHKYNIIHCDLKPENILLKTKNRSIVKVVDFGSSCFVRERIFTYVQSRFYRAPEVMLGIGYGCGVDMWSFGCILAELKTGKPILPGDNEADQMRRIIDLIGYPSGELLERSSRGRDLCWTRRGKPAGRNLRQVLVGMDEDFIDLIEKCLVWDPELRISPKQASEHPWISGVQNSPTGPESGRNPRKTIAFEQSLGSQQRIHRNSLNIFQNNF